MSEHRFTQGEWTQHEFTRKAPMVVTGKNGEVWAARSIHIGSGEKWIGSADMSTRHDGEGYPSVTNATEHEANARLMIAAPKLLAALEACRDAIGESLDVDPRNRQAFVQAESAIAEALDGKAEEAAS